MGNQNYLTRIVHGGEGKVPNAGAVTVPVYFSSTFRQEEFEGDTGYGYARGNNPTREALESLIAELEGGAYGFAFASGMAATQAALSLLNAGDKVIISSNVYGGTYDILDKIFSRFNITFSIEDTSDLKGLEEKITENVKAIFVETPSNPTLTVTDLKGISELAKKYGILTIADNTFMSPYLQQPLKFGIDIVVESATKYLGGHSDLIAGVLAVNDARLAEKIHQIQALAGGIIQPFDCFLLTRGIRTLGLRMDRQTENAEKIVDYLIESKAVTKVNYPGLSTHPNHQIQLNQAKNGGAMLSFELADKIDIAKFFKSLQLIMPGASLGGVESLIGHPASTSHRSIPKNIKDKVGITERLIRLSPGIEYAEDIIADLDQALHEAE
jgi:cystathionine beta-lyase